MISTRFAYAIVAEVPLWADTNLLRAVLNLELASTPRSGGGVFQILKQFGLSTDPHVTLFALWTTGSTSPCSSNIAVFTAFHHIFSNLTSERETLHLMQATQRGWIAARTWSRVAMRDTCRDDAGSFRIATKRLKDVASRPDG